MPEFTQSPLSDEDARKQRQEALSALAHSHLSPPGTASSSSPFGGPTPDQRRTSVSPAPARRPPWLILGSASLAVILVAGIVLHLVGLLPGFGVKSHGGPITVVIAPPLQGQDCPVNAAWSPDGKQIAVIGYSDQCPSDFPNDYNYQAGMLNVYNAATGQLVRIILPDPSVLALPVVPAPPADVQPTSAASDTSKAVINYTQVLWSPDGKRLALPFFVGRWTNVNTTPNYLTAVRGLVLVNADGTGERAVAFTVTNQQIGALIWNTAKLRYVTVQTPSPYRDLVSLPPAMSYSWSANGQLIPGPSLTAPLSSPTMPTGNPDGGSSFTIWQPGGISLYSQGYAHNSPVPIQPPIYSWNTDFDAWSPGGTYLFDAVSLLGIVEPPGEPVPTTAGLQALGWEGAPTVAIHDPAEQRLLLSLHTSSIGSESPPAQDSIAWSPNGRVLAALPEINAPNSQSGNSTSPPLTLYDCASGETLSTLQPRSNSRISANPVAGNVNFFSSLSLLLWSADGSHLLVYSSQLDTITIWGPGALPRSSRTA